MSTLLRGTVESFAYGKAEAERYRFRDGTLRRGC